MSCRVEVTPTARDTILSWGLSKDWLVRLVQRLRGDLETDPDAHLEEVVVPLMLRAYRVRFIDPGPPETPHLVVFYVRRSEDGQQLSVVACRRVIGEED